MLQSGYTLVAQSGETKVPLLFTHPSHQNPHAGTTTSCVGAGSITVSGTTICLLLCPQAGATTTG